MLLPTNLCNASLVALSMPPLTYRAPGVKTVAKLRRRLNNVVTTSDFGSKGVKARETDDPLAR
jgi:hypothetical protein